MTEPERITLCDGKYTVINDKGKLTALRYGEPWRDLTGDNLVYWLFVEVHKSKGRTWDEAASDKDHWKPADRAFY